MTKTPKTDWLRQMREEQTKQWESGQPSKKPKTRKKARTKRKKR